MREPSRSASRPPRLAELFDVVSIIAPYPDRGRSRLIRVYVEIRLGGQRYADRGGTAKRRPQAMIHWAGRQLPLLVHGQ